MKQVLIALFTITSIHSFATNYYVSLAGNNSNSGLSITTPFQTLQYAANLTAAGDTVFVLSGTYTNLISATNVLNIYNSGTPNNWIVFKNYPGNTPVIKLYDQWAGIQLQGADYIVIDGFTVIGNNDSISLAYAQSQQNNLNNPATSGNGIGAAPEYGNSSNKPHHIMIRNCKVSKCGGGGIYTVKADYVTIENNTISECAFYSPYGNSGISLYQNWNSDSSMAVKNYVIGNNCFRNEEYIPFFAVGSITDGNGIIIDDSRNTQNGSTLGVYVGRTYIANNLVFDNGGRGIHCYETDKVVVVNNTCYQNCQSPSVPDGEFTVYNADSISFINNIALPSSGIPPIDKSNSSTINLSVDHNLWATNSGLANPYGTNTVTASPDFIFPSSNPLLADFHLQISSAAKNTGTHFYAPMIDKDGNIRLLTDSVDIGCYEFQSTVGIPVFNIVQNVFSIFPNPATTNISIITNIENANQLEVTFYNNIGLLIKRVVVTPISGKVTIDISEFDKGIYLVSTVDNSNETQSARFIKVKYKQAQFHSYF